MLVDTGSGFVTVASGTYTLNEIVYESCFATAIRGVQVRCHTLNGWVGR